MRRITLASVGALRIFGICYTNVNSGRPVSFSVESPPGELPTAGSVAKETLSLFQRVYFGEPFPFYFFERWGFLLNLGALQDVVLDVYSPDLSKIRRKEEPSIGLIFYGSEIDSERTQMYTVLFRGLSEKEAFKEELWNAKREYHRTASEFFANFPDEET